MSSEPGDGRRPIKHETGSLDAVKGRTDEESTDLVQDTQADTARRRGERECLCEGKHGGSQEQSMMERNLRTPWMKLHYGLKAQV